MSQDDDDPASGPSLKDLVTATLQSNGVLGKIQAQLRASIFLTLEEEFKEKNLPLVNSRANKLLATPQGTLAAKLVKDFLECLDLDFTLSIFEPECNLPSIFDASNEKIDSLNSKTLQDLHCQNGDRRPLIFKLIEEYQSTNNGTEKDVSEYSEEKFTSEGATTNGLLDSNNPDVSEHSSMERDSVSKKTKNFFIQVERDKFGKAYSGNSENVASSLSLSGSDNSNKTLQNKEADSKENSNPSNKEKDELVDQDDLSSLSGLKELPGDNPPSFIQEPLKDETTLPKEKEEAKDVNEEPLQEEIDEDISVDDLLSSSSLTSNATKDASESQAAVSVDYLESL